MHIAATYNNPKAVEILLNAGGDMCIKDEEGQNVLHRAAQEGNFRCTNILMKSPHSIFVLREQDKNGSTPLMLAVGSGDFEVVKCLLNQDGLNKTVNAHNKQLEYPMHSAARSGDLETVDLLQQVSIYRDIQVYGL